ncbi:TrkA family potassium uptake protein [Candidatus Woesearchaeota archaeon]|nr:TrkA family potassium uptake protein [Candidatus Woesearchaeota archaeon]
MKIILVGANESIKSIANMLSSEKHNITIVEQATETAKKIESEIDGTIICGDATDIAILRDAGINEADVIIIGTKDDKTNLMVAEIAKETKVSKIISIVNSSRNEEIFTKLGIYRVVSFVDTIVKQIKDILSQDGNQRLIAHLGDGNIQIIECKLSPKSNAIGKSISKHKEFLIIAVYRDGAFILANPKEIVKEGDVVVLAVESAKIDKINKQLTLL